MTQRINAIRDPSGNSEDVPGILGGYICQLVKRKAFYLCHFLSSVNDIGWFIPLSPEGVRSQVRRIRFQ